jgi:hypothetical protein
MLEGEEHENRRKLNAKSGTATVKVIKEREKEIRQQMDIGDFTYSSG